MRVLVCGSRTWNDSYAVNCVLNGYNDEVELSSERLCIIEGGATGADSCAADYADAWEGDVDHEQFQADWATHGRAAGPIRNGLMLSEGKPDVVWAFVDKPLAESRGTADMVRRAARSGVPTYVVQRIPAGIEDEAVS